MYSALRITDKMKRRYENDHTFFNLVNSFTAILSNKESDIDVSDIEDALILAQERARQQIFQEEHSDLINRVKKRGENDLSNSSD